MEAMKFQKPGLIFRTSTAPAAPPEKVLERIRNYETGCDLWTGRPLKGLDAESWARSHFGLEEDEPLWEDECESKIIQEN